jgi:hypothetical protein
MGGRDRSNETMLDDCEAVSLEMYEDCTRRTLQGFVSFDSRWNGEGINLAEYGRANTDSSESTASSYGGRE